MEEADRNNNNTDRVSLRQLVARNNSTKYLNETCIRKKNLNAAEEKGSLQLTFPDAKSL